jgi:transcriptional regulator with XRE-family HTH domain
MMNNLSIMSYRKSTAFPLLLQVIVDVSGRMSVLNPQQLGQRIKTAREARGLSQEELAELISRDQRSVSEYESGKRRIFAHDLPTIAQALHVPIVYFFDEVLSQNDLDNILLTEFHQMDTKGQQVLVGIAKLLTGSDG